MKTYYATFGNLLIDYHLVLKASSAAICQAWMQRRSGLSGCFSRITEETPDTKPLLAKPTELHYVAPEHI